MHNGIHSKIGIEIISSVNVLGKEMQQNLVATDLYIYTEIAGKQIIYLPEKGQFLINNLQNQLRKVDMSAHISQFKQIKQIIGKLFIQETSTEKGRHIYLKNSESPTIKLEIEVDIISFKRLEETVYHSFEVFQSEMQPASIQLQSNEVVNFSHTLFTIAGKSQESSTKLLDIKLLESPYMYDNYLEWEIIL